MRRGTGREDVSSAVAAAAAGDTDAFWALIGPHDRSLRALAYRLTGDRDAMDDVLQEAYVKAFRALPRFRGGSSIGTWLYRIVYNASMDELRRASRRPSVPLDDSVPAEDPAGDPATTAVQRRDLSAALASLPVDMRAAVLLVDAEGMDYRQAAQVLGVPQGTVASRLNRARKLLRGALSSVGDDRRGGRT